MLKKPRVREILLTEKDIKRIERKEKRKANRINNCIILIMISSSLLIVIFATEKGVEQQPVAEHIKEPYYSIETVKTQIRRPLKELPTIIPTVEPTVALPDKIDKKTYMDYRKITRIGSRQLELQQRAWTDSQGFRKIDDYYMVAMGTFYGEVIGDKYIITLPNGKEIKAILGDIKADKHTDENNQYHLLDGSIVEFIIDKEAIDEKVKRTGDCSHIIGFGIKSIRREE